MSFTSPGARIADLEKGMSAASTVESTPQTRGKLLRGGCFLNLDDTSQWSPHRSLGDSDTHRSLAPGTPASLSAYRTRGYALVGEGSEGQLGALYSTSASGNSQKSVAGGWGRLHRESRLIVRDVQVVGGDAAASSSVARRLDVGMSL